MSAFRPITNCMRKYSTKKAIATARGTVTIQSITYRNLLFSRTREEIVSMFYTTVRAVNEIFSTNNFAGVTGINVAVKKITVIVTIFII